MDDLWPRDITSEDVVSPEDILTEQAGILSDKTNGLLRAEVVKNVTDDRIVLGLEVSATYGDRRVRIAEVEHRREFGYPARLKKPPALPDYLKDKVYQSPPFAGIGALIQTEGKWVDNEGVAGTPSEFHEKLSEHLRRKAVKATVLSILHQSQEAHKTARPTL